MILFGACLHHLETHQAKWHQALELRSVKLDGLQEVSIFLDGRFGIEALVHRLWLLFSSVRAKTKRESACALQWLLEFLTVRVPLAGA